MGVEKIYKSLDGQGNELQNWSGEKLASDPTGVGLYQGRQWFNTTDNVFRYYDGVRIQTVVTLEELTKIGTFQGVQDATLGVPTNTIDGTAIVAGDFWRVSVGGTITGIGGDDALEVGDLIYALVDGASSASDFTAVQANLDLTNNIGQVEEVTLASLPANTPTAVPTTFTSAYSIEAYDSSNNRIGLCFTGSVTSPMVESSATLSNVIFRVVGN